MSEKTKILIIDDETDFSNLLAKWMRRIGYDVICYPKGDSAVATTRELNPDLVLLDINLPDISGLELYERLQQNRPFNKHLPIIFLSAMHDKENYCLDTLVADGFLKKPCSAKAVVSMIEQTLESKH